MLRRYLSSAILPLAAICALAISAPLFGQQDVDSLRELQFQAVELKQSSWAHWGNRTDRFSSWTTHSNRLIPVFSFGMELESVRGENSVYRDEKKIKSLYGYLPERTLNPKADYFDQTDIYHLNKTAWKSGKKNLILMVFDGMDWETIQAAAIYRNRQMKYKQGRGSGLAFQDYKKGNSQYGFCVTSPHNGDTKTDVNTQVVTSPGSNRRGGYSFEFGGSAAGETPADPLYLMGKRRSLPHAYTDSAASATSLNSGLKTYNGAINIGPEGEKITTLAHEMQKEGISIGVVTSVPISHATPASVYSHNVTRNDYQDLTRDLIGLRSITHREQALSGVDVLIGGGFGEVKDDDRTSQGANYVPGNKYLSDADAKSISIDHGGKYVVSTRSDKPGAIELQNAAERAAKGGHRLFGFYGGKGGHLPYATADGKYDPTRGVSNAERYSEKDRIENPTLAEMTTAALTVLETNEKGFYLMIEAGDVDWANHNNNIDDSIGAVYCGEAAFQSVVDWVEKNSNWDETSLVLTADHGHMFVLDDPRALMGQLKPIPQEKFLELRLKLQREEAARKAKEEAAKKAKAAALKAKKEAAKKEAAKKEAAIKQATNENK